MAVETANAMVEVVIDMMAMVVAEDYFLMASTAPTLIMPLMQMNDKPWDTTELHMNKEAMMPDQEEVVETTVGVVKEMNIMSEEDAESTAKAEEIRPMTAM